MSNSLETSVKKTPCNGCRERKRKCSYEQPCARCIKFNITCIYTVMTSPKDIEYMQELEYMKQIETMQQQITFMETELTTLKLTQEIKSPSTRIPEVKKELTEGYYDYPSPISLSNQQDDISKQSHCQHDHYKGLFGFKDKHHKVSGLNMDEPRNRMIAKCKSIKAIVSQKEEEKPWTLTVTNGNMSIETYINSHADLMTHLEKMASTCVYQNSTCKLPFPFFKEPWASKNAIGTALGIITWRKYGKSRFKSLTDYATTLLRYDGKNRLTESAPAENIEDITMGLLNTYINCLHTKTFYIHVPSFIRLFVKDRECITQSPAVMALCSVICHQNCKHIGSIIPNDAIADYGIYYFDQARELIADQFDQANLETLFTFTFMAVFKTLSKNDIEGNRYLSIAECIYKILSPHYDLKENGVYSGEFILYSRVYGCIQRTRSVIRLHEIMLGMYKSRSSIPKISRLLEDLADINICVAKDDSPREISFIQMRAYLVQLRDAIKYGIGNISAGDFPTFIGLFGHQVEMAMRHWYRNILPQDFQLQIPLFEDSCTDIEFFTKLELECGESPIPLLITIILYNEYLIMSKSYIPRRPDEIPPKNEDLVERFKEMQDHAYKHKYEHDRLHHWFKLIEKMRHVKRHHQQHPHQDENQEKLQDGEIIEFIQALNLSEVSFNMPFIHTSVLTALNLVRLVQFLMSRDYACFLDLRWIMNAWQILLRAAKFKYQQPGDSDVTLDRIRANLVLCLNIIRDQLKLSRRDSSGSFLDEMELEFNKLF